ncbi:MAG: TraB/GumN family protein [Chryseobacterium sp.]|nr:TraB/GumN family protein [Chryseobacterium sp.]
MKKLISGLLAAFLLIPIAYKAQEEGDKNSLLWEVTGKGSEKPSYLFGTFHMMCKDDFRIPKKVQKALSSTDNFAMEINFSDPKAMLEMQNMLVSDKKWTEKFSDEEIKRVTKALESLEYNLDEIAQLSPIALYSMISVKSFECAQNELKMIDLELMQSALSMGKEITGLESVKDQVQVFQKFLTKKEIISMIENASRNKEETQLMLKVYLSEDMEQLGRFFTESESISENQKKILLNDRNLQWMKKISELLKEKSVFFAVGAGHLPGEHGLISLLRKNGYQVRPVTD